MTYICLYLQMNILLVSSDYSFPYVLEKLGLNILDIQTRIYAGEASPARTYELLTTRWGVGPHLATALVEHCGGHLWDIEVTLRAFRRLGRFNVFINPELYACVDRCLDAVAGDDKCTARMITTLRTLGERGFHAVDNCEDPVVQHIGRCAVGGLVKQGSIICGFDWAAHGGDRWKFGLVPTRSSMRLAIANVLHRRGLLESTSVVVVAPHSEHIEQQWGG